MVLGYCDHYVVDGGKARIILSALVAPASIMDNTPILDLVDRVCDKWKLKPKLAFGDSRYGTISNIAGFEERGIKAYLAAPPHALTAPIIRKLPSSKHTQAGA